MIKEIKSVGEKFQGVERKAKSSAVILKSVATKIKSWLVAENDKFKWDIVHQKVSLILTLTLKSRSLKVLP